MDIDRVLSDEEVEKFVPAKQQSVMNALKAIRNPKNGMEELLKLMSDIVQQLERLVLSGRSCLQCANGASDTSGSLSTAVSSSNLASPKCSPQKCFESTNSDNGEDYVNGGEGLPYAAEKNPARGETLLLMLDRWRKLHKDFYNEKKGGFDITKIPDINDAARYDCLHNSHLSLLHLPSLYDASQILADCVVPQEYGIDVGEKLVIGSKMCSALMEKIKYDLIIARSDNELDMQYRLDESHAEDLTIKSVGRQVRTRLYFTSESHLQTLLNVLRYPIDGKHEIVSNAAKQTCDRTQELCYLTSFVMRLYEDPQKDYDDPSKFRVEALFSPGMVQHPLRSDDHLKTKPLTVLNKNLTCAQVEERFDIAIALAAQESLHDAAQLHNQRINTLVLDKEPQAQKLSKARAKESFYPYHTLLDGVSPRARAHLRRGLHRLSSTSGYNLNGKDNNDNPDIESLQRKRLYILGEDNLWELERKKSGIGLGGLSMRMVMAAAVGAGITFFALRKRNN